MNRILNAGQISTNHPVALIEPGVTQGQLYEFLRQRCPQLMFNVTGSACDTSIVGNCLDRGVGYLGPRADDLFGLEVVLGTGQVIQTGFRRLGEGSPLAQCHPHGLGPMLDGLFFQGNFGIVTSACFRLIPRRPVEVALSFRLPDPRLLAPFIDEIVAMKREALLPAVIHIGNRARTRTTLEHGIVRYLANTCGLAGTQLEHETSQALAFAAPGEWSGMCALSGNAGQVRAVVGEVRRRLRGLAKVLLVDERRLSNGFRLLNAGRAVRSARVRAAAIAAIRPLHGLALGVPTDEAVSSLLAKFGQGELQATQFGQSSCGLLYISPALPTDGAHAVRLVDSMTEAAASFGQTLFVTLNIEAANAVVAVANVLFDQTKREQVEQAHRCSEALEIMVRGQGLEVYRARIDSMAAVVSSDADYWQFVRSMKLTLDPQDLIAPGRYSYSPD